MLSPPNPFYGHSCRPCHHHHSHLHHQHYFLPPRLFCSSLSTEIHLSLSLPRFFHDHNLSYRKTYRILHSRIGSTHCIYTNSSIPSIFKSIGSWTFPLTHVWFGRPAWHHRVAFHLIISIMRQPNSLASSGIHEHSFYSSKNLACWHVVALLLGNEGWFFSQD